MPPAPRSTRERSMRERMLAGEPYLANDPKLTAERRRAARLLQRFNSIRTGDSAQQRKVLTQLLGALGADVEVRPPLYCDYGYRTRIGARTFVNFCLVALDVASITIGEDVQIGPYVQLLTPTHPVEAEARRSGWESAKPIVIGDNVWLGGGVIVCPGVTIGRDTVVGAGAVVVRPLPAGVVAAGNPARVIRRLS